MTNITYFQSGPAALRVRLNGEVVGTITPSKPGFWHYTPKGSKVSGEDFPSLAAVKRSLEIEQ